MEQKNKYFTTIHEQASEPLRYCKARPNHLSYSNINPSDEFLTCKNKRKKKAHMNQKHQNEIAFNVNVVHVNGYQRLTSQTGRNIKRSIMNVHSYMLSTGLISRS